MSIKGHENCKVIGIRHHEKEVSKPFGYKIFYCRTCEAPIAAQFIIADDPENCPKVSDLAKVQAGQMKPGTATIENADIIGE